MKERNSINISFLRQAIFFLDCFNSVLFGLSEFFSTLWSILSLWTSPKSDLMISKILQGLLIVLNNKNQSHQARQCGTVHAYLPIHLVSLLSMLAQQPSLSSSNLPCHPPVPGPLNIQCTYPVTFLLSSKPCRFYSFFGLLSQKRLFWDP